MTQQRSLSITSDPVWAAQLVLLAAILLDAALPEKLTLGPSWLTPAVEVVLLVGLTAMSGFGPVAKASPISRRVAIALIAIVSADNGLSLVLLVHYLIHGGKQGGRPLILAGIVLWLTNVLLFSLWYWQLDRGGPYERAVDPDAAPDFLFPQMSDPRFAPPGWRPTLIDYLFVSFTNASAFSPTDAMPLTRTAKALMAMQATIALGTVLLVVSRAVGILQ